ncbi:MFS general substrate transporter [Marasmius fiardii PR-910]|nr:MFS general substrate transporter [Marasmius fiardii PR-910]
MATSDKAFKDVKEVEQYDSSLDIETESVNERRTLRYIDFRILPILAITYSFSLIDRTNLSSAMVAGMAGSLKLTVGERYSIVTLIYFIPYILLQIPGNAILRAVGVRNCMSFVVVSWGAVTIGMGFTEHWGTLALCRLILALHQAVFFPGMVFIISTWYKRHEVQKRLAAFYLSSVLIGGFSSILAYGLSQLNGKGGLAGWSWIFIIEGIITVAIGLLNYFLIPDFPDRNRFLSKAQTAFVLKRIEDDRGDSLPDEITLDKVLHYCKDWKLWVYGCMFGCATLPSYMLAFFMPIILGGMNYSQTLSLLLSAPPYGFAFITAITIAWMSDKARHRCSFVILQASLTIIGCCMTAFAERNAPRYAGSAGTTPAVLAWGANNVLTHSKRSVQSAITVIGGGIGGILASTVFRQKDAPRYIPGLWVTIGAQILCISLATLISTHSYRMNKKSREGKLSAPLEGRVGFYYTT